MTKAIVFSDLHLHAHKDRVDRLQDCLNVLEWIFEQAIKNDCQYIFFLGDLFHERSKIDVLNYLKTFEVFMKYMLGKASHIEAYLLVGNHDMYHKERWDVNSVKPLSAIPNVNIIESPTRLSIGGRNIDWMPHTDNPVSELNKLKQENNGAGDILFGHMSVHGAMTNVFYGTKSDVLVEYDNEMVTVDVGMFKDWKMVVLGHYHGAQQLNDSVEYIGSPLQLSFGEAFQTKHIMLLDLENLSKTYINNDFSPGHLIVTANDIETENYDFNGQFVRVTVDDLSQKEVLDLQKKISVDYKPLSVDTKQKEKKLAASDEHVVEDAKSILYDTAEMLNKYVNDKGVPKSLDRNKLLAIGNQCLDSQLSDS